MRTTEASFLLPVKKAYDQGDVSLAEISKLTGLHRSTIYRAVTGRSNPPVTTVQLILDGYQVIVAKRKGKESWNKSNHDL